MVAAFPLQGQMTSNLPVAVAPAARQTSPSAPMATNPTPARRARTLREARERVLEQQGGDAAHQAMFQQYNDQLFRRLRDAVDHFCGTQAGQDFLRTRATAGPIKFQIRNHSDGSVTDVKVLEEKIGGRASERLAGVLYGAPEVPWSNPMKRLAGTNVFQDLWFSSGLVTTNVASPRF